MTRLIDADSLKDAIIDAGQSSKRYKVGEFWELNCREIDEVINNVPTVDAVRVVRCKECKYYREGDPEHPDCGWCRRLICGTVASDFYCADGERKADE